MNKNEILNYLPQIFSLALKPGTPLEAILGMMEEMHDPGEKILESLHTFFDPRRTREKLVPFLAHWINIEWLLTEGQQWSPYNKGQYLETLTNGLGRLREIIANGAFLTKWRGTADGLSMFITIATGIEAIRIDQNPPDDFGNAIPFHINVLIDKSVKKLEQVIRIIVEQEKPAHLTYNIIFE
jgi:phage tail-like protein